MEATGVFQIGEIKIHIGKPGRGHGPEFWAERAAERIMSIADTAPEPIKMQALAFKEKMQYVILDAVKSAVKERQAMNAMLAEKVSGELADQIRREV